MPVDPKPIHKLLIANRGEIAVRIIRACREAGIATVQVFSEADRQSLPVRLADRAVCIGPAPASQSYLNQTALISAALSFGAEAIHPGYGFLSENPDFAELCEAEGLMFVGPQPAVVRAMGSKIEAKRIARDAGVPVIPGSENAVTTLSEALEVAREIGFPILLKASAGGGGRGMRIVEQIADLDRALTEATAEAAAAFGNPAVYVERYFTNLRHIEVQVLGDGANVVHLGERDCTTQRRNQKLVEEGPSPALDPELRKRLGEAALLLCRSVSYQSAGTIEFILDEDTKQFFFMEMNTRIQVEHPVTEMITGVDLVKHQLHIASTGKLELNQSQIELRGHAIECRINAEDHTENFRPSPGRISRLRLPGGPGIRVDSFVDCGMDVQPYYDSLLAKVITWGSDRNEAIARMNRALDEMQIEGVKTTIPFHRELLGHPRFRAGEINTRFVHDVLSY